ncbi:MAG TPA: molybdopterin-dependent oxidoreductase, partial [Thermomicrobiales bacterium]|nr:molybdopterin-dependent oxidoreductase [Thermomicrobiales bacterium]
TRRYDETTWRFAGASGSEPADADAPDQDGESYDQRVGAAGPVSDPTLQHPRCVFQILRRHFQRYTPEMVEASCGVPADQFLQVAEAICANSGPERTTAFAYAVAWTQHTTGTQIIACCAVLQLLLGNIGRPGGGIMALRGHATIQGSTDIPTLFNLLPGYLPMPSALEAHETLPDYLDAVTARTGWWHNAPAYAVSLLKAYYGDAATAANDYCYELLPKLGGDYSFQPMLTKMLDGEIRGLFCMGQNPAVGGQNASLARRGLATLDWLVVRDAFEIETATFWRDGPEVCDGTLSPETIGTEVFFLPAAMASEKEGSFTNTQRLMQWHDRAVLPPGDARSEAWFIHQLALRLRRLYAGESGPAARQLASLDWPYAADERGEPRLDEVLLEINGYRCDDRAPVQGYVDLTADGSTACGCWIYSGVMPAPGRNLSRNRDAGGPAALGWGWSWPANRRTLYNRASARPDGQPWSERKRWIWWDAAAGRWTGYDVPDFPLDKPPDYAPPPGALGIAAHPGDAPFIMMTDGRGQLFTPNALRDGPLPTHYEAWESPVANALYPDQRANPAAIPIENRANPYDPPGDPAYPHVLTTYRLTEHHTAGGMTR